MTEYEDLIQIEGVDDGQKEKALGRRMPKGRLRGSSSPTKKVGNKQKGGRGCTGCPLDTVKGIQKIFGKVRGKSVFVWAQSPGLTENKEGKELIGKAGQWWWREAKAAGLKREDCDIQNVVRCVPADYESDMYPPLSMRDPTKDEIRHCSIYNEQALALSKAKVHIILGRIAAQILLGKEFKKDQRVFWSSRMNGKVVCLDHPSFFLRRGGENVPRKDPKLIQFRRDLRYAVTQSQLKTGGRFAYLESQDYQGVTSPVQARRAYREILKVGKTGRRISVDVEEGYVDDRGRAAKECSGRRVMLVVGFCVRVGHSKVFALDHPDSPATPRARRYNRKLVRKLLSRTDIRFVCQHGSYDVQAIRQLLGVRVKGYDYDTQYGEYFCYPERHSFALEAIADARYPEFAGYKEIKVPDSFTESFTKEVANLSKLTPRQQWDKAKKFPGSHNLALMPWKKIVLYNGADNDIQKRIEVHTKDRVRLPLMHVYRDAAFVMDRMEKNPPRFDYKHYDKLVQIYPVLAKRLYKRLAKMAGKKDFNPNSPKQVYHVIYEKLGLPIIEGNDNTRKETLAALSGYHKFPDLLVEYRRLAKICSTYLAGFKNSADANAGCVRTIWWLTGTRTGRLSSGGGDSGENGVVNLQNIHGDPLLQCLLVSDVNWRDIYNDWKARTEIRVEGRDKDTGEIVYGYIGGFTEKSWLKYADRDVLLGFDHSQMELRVVAQKSRDKALITIFNSDKDLHSEVGHMFTGWPVKVLLEDEGKRRIVKNVQFGIVYGITEDNLPVYLRAKGVKNVDDEKVRGYMRQYFARFKRVKKMIDMDRELVQERGWVETLFGFRRYLKISRETDEGGAFWGNQAVNTPIQGTAHQLMLIGLIPLKRKPKTYALLQTPQLEIHDAVYFRVKLHVLFQAAVLGQHMLEKEALTIVKRDFGIDWQVPLKAEPKAAFRFGAQVKLKPGMKEWEFLNAWCQKNHKLQIKLAKQMKGVN